MTNILLAIIMTRRLTILITFLFFTSLSFGQRVSETDSLLIISKVKSVFNVFRKPNFSEFKKLSTERIYCIICLDKPEFRDAPNMERRRFYNHHLKEIGQCDGFTRAMKSTEVILVNEIGDRTGITVLFTIYKKDELAPGHEGGQLGMYFKKVNNVYKFAGIETIP